MPPLLTPRREKGGDIITTQSLPPQKKNNPTKIKSGWLLTYPSDKYDFVSWDDYSIPN